MKCKTKIIKIENLNNVLQTLWLWEVPGNADIEPGYHWAYPVSSFHFDFLTFDFSRIAVDVKIMINAEFMRLWGHT